MNITATNHEVISAKPVIQKMSPAYSPAVDRAKPTGVKPMMVTMVPDNIGAAVWLHA